MGEAFNRAGEFLGSAQAESMTEVARKLEEQHGGAIAEMRIRHLAPEDPYADPILKYFEYAHLPGQLMAVSEPFGRLAKSLIETLPRCPERTVALRKLLEAKDAAVRAALP